MAGMTTPPINITPGKSTLTVPDRLFNRLIAMREAYGDANVAVMLDRLTESPARLLGITDSRR
jgi:hypothetical protein